MIMYPEDSLLDKFLEQKRLHKDPRKNFRLVDGEVVFNPFIKKILGQRSPPKLQERPQGKKITLNHEKSQSLSKSQSRRGSQPTTTSGSATKSPKKPNFFSKQEDQKDAQALQAHLNKQSTILKDNKVMSKEDMIHLLEDSISLAFNGA